MMCRFHVQTAGSSLTAQSIDNNVVRTTIQALSAVLGGAQSLHTNSRDEALALPTAEAARLALRTQQILAYESGRDRDARPARRLLLRRAPDRRARGRPPGRTSTRSRRSAARWRRSSAASSSARSRSRPTGSSRRSRRGDQVVVGVNQFVDDDGATARPALQRIDPGRRGGPDRRASGGSGRSATRRPGRPRCAGSTTRPAATDNLLPPLIEAVKAYATRRRDQRSAAGRLGRAPRADHGLRRRECRPVRVTSRPERSIARHFGRVHHVAVVVRDLEAALGFYRDVLGLPLDVVQEVPGDRVRIAFLSVGESKIELVSADRRDDRRRPLPGLARARASTTSASRSPTWPPS